MYADVDLVAVDVDEATAELNQLGFFAAGLILHGPDGHDHLRLQLLDCEEVELEAIVCDSPFADDAQAAGAGGHGPRRRLAPRLSLSLALAATPRSVVT